MEFTKSFEEMLNMASEIFANAGVGTSAFYKNDKRWEKLCKYVEGLDVVCIHSGLSKFIFDFEDEDFVLKIPFCGSYNWHDMSFDNYAIDHCKKEVKDYNYLKDTEVGDLFVSTEYVGCIDGVHIYVQPKVEVFCYEHHSPSEESYRDAEALEWYECVADDDDTIAAFIEFFGIDNVEHIFSVLDDLEIKDIHHGNFGYLDNKLVIFDFSGYWG